MFDVNNVALEDEPAPEPEAMANDNHGRRRPRWKRLALAGGIVVVILGSIQAALFVKEARTKLDIDAVGKKAPDFTLELLAGGDEKVTLASFRGRPVVVNFFASWCHTCKQEAPVLAEAWRNWRATGVQFLGIDSRDSRQWGLEFEEKYGVEYPTLFDGPGRVMDRYGATGHPETFFIDPEGQIVAKYVGPLDAPTLDGILVQLVGTSPDSPKSEAS